MSALAIAAAMLATIPASTGDVPYRGGVDTGSPAAAPAVWGAYRRSADIVIPRSIRPGWSTWRCMLIRPERRVQRCTSVRVGRAYLGVATYVSWPKGSRARVAMTPRGRVR